MLGKRSAQRGLFEADALLADFVGQRTFYGFLASQRDELFRDEDFAALYCRDNGRPKILHAQAVARERHRIGLNTDGRLLPAADADQSYSR